MPRVQWPLRHGRPCLEVVLTRMPAGSPWPRILLADSGAGSVSDDFELIIGGK